MLATTLAALATATLALAAPRAPRAPVEHPILWRAHPAGAQTIFVICPTGVGYTVVNGDLPSMYNAADLYQYKYCAAAFTLDTTGGQTSIGLRGGMCLDATLNPAPGVTPHAWTCYPGTKQQTWKVRCNGLIELVGTGLCLEGESATPTGPRSVHLATCQQDKVAQQWYFQSDPKA